MTARRKSDHPAETDWKSRYESVEQTNRMQGDRIRDLMTQVNNQHIELAAKAKEVARLKADRYRLLENQRRLLRNHLSVSRALSEAHDVLTDLREDVLRQTNQELTKMERGPDSVSSTEIALAARD